MRRSTTTPTKLLARLTGAGLTRALATLERFGRTSRARPATAGVAVTRLPSVTSIDDPDGSIRLIGVAGLAESETIDQLARAVFDDPIVSVHIDVTGVAGWMPDALARLEGVLDEAEYVGFRIRVIGLDPAALLLLGQIQA